MDDIKARVSSSVRFHNIDLFKIFALLFAFILAFYSIFVGIVAPFVDQGEFAGLNSSMLLIKSRASPNDFIAGFQIEVASYYINLYDLQLYVFSLTMRPEIEEVLTRGAGILRQIKLNGKLLMDLKPRFILESRVNFNYYYNVTMKEWVFRNYDLVYFSRPLLGYQWEGTEYQEWLVFERKS